MIFKIKKGDHYSQKKFKFWWNRRSFKWAIKFDDSCKYYFNDSDEYDINKLIGIGWLPQLHVDSVRFGWTYNNITDKVDIFSYCYIKSTRYMDFITSIKIGEIYNLSIDINKDAYILTANNISVSINHTNNKKIQYLLRPYFGGNKPAPNDITITVG